MATQATDTHEVGIQIAHINNSDQQNSPRMDDKESTREMSVQASEAPARDMATQASFKECHEMGTQVSEPIVRDMATQNTLKAKTAQI